MRYRHTKINYYVHSPRTNWHNSRPVLLSSSYASRNVSKISTAITEEKKSVLKTLVCKLQIKSFMRPYFLKEDKIMSQRERII